VVRDADLSFSAGVAEFSDAMVEVRELVEAADRNLYQAKAARSAKREAAS
jgi:GGDEF domain-containing protein